MNRIVTRNLDSLINRTKPTRVRARYAQLCRRFFDGRMQSYQFRAQQIVIEVVYFVYQPKSYDRTYNLSQATRSVRVGDFVLALQITGKGDGTAPKLASSPYETYAKYFIKGYESPGDRGGFIGMLNSGEARSISGNRIGTKCEESKVKKLPPQGIPFPRNFMAGWLAHFSVRYPMEFRFNVAARLLGGPRSAA